MKKVLLVIGAVLGIAVVVGLIYAANDDRAIGAKRRAKSIADRSSIRNAVSSTKQAATSVADAATAVIGRKVDEAAEEFSDAADDASDKVAKATRRSA